MKMRSKEMFNNIINKIRYKDICKMKHNKVIKQILKNKKKNKKKKKNKRKKKNNLNSKLKKRNLKP